MSPKYVVVISMIVLALIGSRFKTPSDGGTHGGWLTAFLLVLVVLFVAMVATILPHLQSSEQSRERRL